MQPLGNLEARMHLPQTGVAPFGDNDVAVLVQCDAPWRVKPGVLALAIHMPWTACTPGKSGTVPVWGYDSDAVIIPVCDYHVAVAIHAYPCSEEWVQRQAN